MAKEREKMKKDRENQEKVDSDDNDKPVLRESKAMDSPLVCYYKLGELVM